MTSKVLNDARLIAGIFREAMFYSRQISMSNSASSVNAIISDFIEESARAKEGLRYLHLTATESFEPEDLASPYSFRCSFPKFLIEWTAPIERLENGEFRISMPQAVAVQNKRSRPRVEPVNSELIQLSVLVQTEGLHTEGQFTVENFSQHGVGGVLRILDAIPINTRTMISGFWTSKSGSFRVSGVIRQAQLLEGATKPAKESLYRIGMQQISQSGISKVTKDEKRRSLRTATEFLLEVGSPFNVEHTIQLKVVNASVTGFAAHLVEKADASLLPVGSGLAVRDSSMVAELVGIEEQLYRFQIIHSQEGDRLAWLKRLSKSFYPGISTTSPTGKEIFELFCESGAAASAYLKRQSWNADALTKGLSIDANGQDWMHRWIERTSEGQLRGHVCAIRYADNLWHIGDLAGMLNEQQRISKDFVPLFFRSFRDYCMSCSPCPRFLIGWNSGHPSWAEWESHLRKNPAGVAFMFSASYHRFGALSESKDADWAVKPVESSDYGHIEKLLDASAENGTSELLKSLDFTASAFSSPLLKRILGEAKHVFVRCYFEISNQQERYVLVTQQFPAGTTPLRTLDVPWLIPLGPRPDEAFPSPSLLSCIHALGLASGAPAPGVLCVRTEESSADHATKRMLWTIGHPSLLDLKGAQRP